MSYILFFCAGCSAVSGSGVDAGSGGVPQRQNRCNIDAAATAVTPPPVADGQRGPTAATTAPGVGSDADRRPPLNDDRRGSPPPRQSVGDGDAAATRSTPDRAPSSTARASPAAR